MPFEMTSSSIREGDPIPRRFTADGEDLSPPLAWSSPPEETRSLLLVCDDPDAPRKTFTHWILFNLPPDRRELAEGVPSAATLADGSRQGTNDFQKIGFGGPAPPPGKPHRYDFKLCALDTMLELDPGASRQEIFEAVQGHILGEARLMGTYGRDA